MRGSGDRCDRRQAHLDGQGRREGSPVDADTGLRPVIARAVVATADESRPLRAAASSPPFSLAPRQRLSGGKERLGRITKMGDGYLRKPLVVGASTSLHQTTGAVQTSVIVVSGPRCLQFSRPIAWQSEKNRETSRSARFYGTLAEFSHDLSRSRDHQVVRNLSMSSAPFAMPQARQDHPGLDR